MIKEKKEKAATIKSKKPHEEKEKVKKPAAKKPVVKVHAAAEVRPRKPVVVRPKAVKEKPAAPLLTKPILHRPAVMPPAPVIHKEVVHPKPKTEILARPAAPLSETHAKPVAQPETHKPVVHKPEPHKISPVHPPVNPPVHPPAHKPVPVHPVIQKPVVSHPVTQKSAPAHPSVHPPAHKPVPAHPAAPVVEQPVVKSSLPAKEVELELPISVKDLAIRLGEKPSILLKDLMAMKVMVSINHTLQEETVVKLCTKYNCVIKKALAESELALQMHEETDDASKLKPRPPIVTFMGHVDHGKTSLLDAIRKTNVVDSEHGGITQHIGAYRVKLSKGEITFLDTPGHEAFTAMRSRGAQVTDIVVLVVAADDGIMPQTEEAIDHARAAGVPIIVALNKIDKPQAEPDRVKKQLQAKDLVAEDWGGKTIVVPVSAKTGEGIDRLLEMILLEAEMKELKSNPDRFAKGIVIEARMEKGRGPVATLLVQNGTLHLNENIIVGNYFGRIRAMFNDRGQAVTTAGPAVPVEVLGISDAPAAGEQFYVIAEERLAKEMAAKRLQQARDRANEPLKRVSLEDLHAQIAAGKIKELRIILKADVQGSLEAIKDVISKIPVSEIKIVIIHTGVGSINTSDVVLAVASDALILGFNVTADERAKEMVDKEGIDVKIYNIIYELANELRAAIEGMLEPKLKRVFVGRAEVRKVIKLTRGIIAGCYVTKGKFTRQVQVGIVRNGEEIFEGKLASLKRFKDDVKEVAEGFECGMIIGGFDKLLEGDLIEAFEVQKILRKL